MVLVMMYKEIKRLVQYGINNNLMNQEDYSYAVNKICDLLKISDFIDEKIEEVTVSEPSSLLNPLLDFAVTQNVIEVDTVLNRDLFEAKIMDCIIPKPSGVIKNFNELCQSDSKEATNYFYDLSQKSNYIKTSRTSKNIIWKSNTPYGELDMTINLSKPEKDPRDIIASKNTSSTSYPKCLLCKEHVGFSGRPGRTSHRIIPLKLNNEDFYLQYSPYVYYNEHSIVLMKEHNPMNVTVKTFKRLFDFVDMFPHYFLGSNAGLPIVGGSILAHEHYQGGAHHFAIEDAELINEYNVEDVTIKQLKWPLSVLRLESLNKKSVIDFAHSLFNYWENYSDESVGIFSKTTEQHNAITPIARKNGETYIIDMTLRNNRTSEDFPLGIFHPHPENHHIKKENIGLIEVMGLAVLPARLKDEIPVIKEAILNDTELPKELDMHSDWLTHLKNEYNGEDLNTFINNEIAIKFMRCIEDAGVFKQTEEGKKAFNRFTEGFINDISK